MFDEELLTLPQIAEMLHVNPSTVRLWVHQQRLPAHKAGGKKWLVRRSDLDALLGGEGHGRPSQAPGGGEETGSERVARGVSAQPGEVESGRSRAGTEPLVPTQTAIEQLRRADERWAAALRGLDRYPRRLRTLADAAEHESRALTLADLANVKWNPRPGARNLRLAYELEAASGRPGPAALWTRFDRAVRQLGVALEGEEIKPIAEAFSRIATSAGELADACDELDAATARKTG
jgi:excisionase family DNA binding protein